MKFVDVVISFAQQYQKKAGARTQQAFVPFDRLLSSNLELRNCYLESAYEGLIKNIFYYVN